MTRTQIWAALLAVLAGVTAVTVSQSAWFVVLLAPTVVAAYMLGLEQRREKEGT